ncbi:CRE-NHR-53 protein [Aphelenchoides avenae]|nr:CRE-NHR-53 protein [Aphelenchus avenae]
MDGYASMDSSPSPTERTPSVSAECLVCGGPAVHKHFGNALSCNSCCAFFRRTVSMNKNYVCKARKNCALRFDAEKQMCKFCRFRKCLDVGMQISAVTAVCPERTPSYADNPLKRLILCRKAIFVSRHRATAIVYGGQENVPEMSNRPKTAYDCGMALRAEFIVVCDFLRDSGVLDCFDGDRDFICQSLAAVFLYSWQVYENAANTLKNFGHHSRRMFCINESYVDVTESALEAFYRTDPRISDQPHVVRHGMTYYNAVLDMARKLSQARLDETENAVLTFILLVNSARKLVEPSDDFPLASLLDSVFRGLKKHYEQNYEDVALRLDNIIQLAHELQRVRHMFEEHVIILRLYGKPTLLAEIEAAAQERKLHSLVRCR